MKKKQYRNPEKVVHFGNDRTTRGALLQFGLFILVVLFLYWITGAFNDW